MVISSASASAASILVLICLSKSSWAFTNPSRNARFIKSHLAYSASDLLYEDQQKAKARRADEEQRLLGTNIKPLLAKKIKQVPVKRGSGFGAGKRDTRTPSQRLAVQQAKIMSKDGVMRIDNVLDGETCDRMRVHVLRQQELADVETAKNAALSEDYYGVENRRKNRCDLLLSLVSGEEDEDDITLDVLRNVLGEEGTLRPIYEELVSNDGEFYEFAAVITNPGSDRQQIHPDLPHRNEAPLYVIFLALQDITEAMGPTTFLLGTHTKKERSKFDDSQMKDEQLANAKSRLALLKKGDAVLFDARILHCGNANEEEGGSTRAMFNFSFRNPKESGSLGYCGSMRPGYVGKISLGDVGAALEQHKNGLLSPFSKLGDGLSC
mmetsp:Transcript_11145/g.20166  ORF Transcript_11145/g.20166 Transcript_11145/m.20166 type:complete len:381 (+) Transcript_11145:267-1409(+)|eukprot:CAMPEP_0196131382 /NCGR_PEP_ID=MMETSP0910-20130528/1416_1 /TAXON_ID=49265 /ORGANISM="Thalassiosira rotula, Strain GSO102" /LENGTH=380 /DNA_ID=CAMNT_0041390847 /DNA_START=572 /DNA_END=1714 /DNA_ORIENTATION=-